MVRLILLHEANKWFEPQKDTEIYINAESVVSLKKVGFDDGVVTQIDTSSGRYFVRENVEDVRSLISNHRKEINY